MAPGSFRSYQDLARYIESEMFRAFRSMAASGPLQPILDCNLEYVAERSEHAIVVRTGPPAPRAPSEVLAYRIVVPPEYLIGCRPPSANEVTHLAMTVWSGVYDDLEVERLTADARADYEFAIQHGASGDVVVALRQNYEYQRERALAHQRQRAHPMFAVGELAPDLGPRAVNYVTAQDAMWVSDGVGPPRPMPMPTIPQHAGVTSPGPAMTATEVRARQEAAYRQAARYGVGLAHEAMYEAEVLRELVNRGLLDAGLPPVPTTDAQKRGLDLLKNNLTPAQLAQYEASKHFDVVGSNTGRTYRIKYGRQMNIWELGKDGQPVRNWCFLPVGGLVEGDCMLAQKIALENDEPAALEIANLISGPPPDRAPPWSRWSFSFIGPGRRRGSPLVREPNRG